MAAKRVRIRVKPSDGSNVILLTMRGESDNPKYRRTALLADTPLGIPPLHELAQVFSHWVLPKGCR
jgi:hypothetical protein